MKRCCRFILFLIFVLGLMACQTESINASEWRWSRAETGLQRQAIMAAVAADPLDPNHLWAGYYAAGGLATSHDGGQTWLTNVEGIADNPVFDLLPVVYTLDGQPKVEVWAATRDGLLVSLDHGDSWQPVSKGLPPASVSALAADATGRVYVGLDEIGIYLCSNSGWNRLGATG